MITGWGYKAISYLAPPNVPLLRALWSLLDGISGVLKGSWGCWMGHIFDYVGSIWEFEFIQATGVYAGAGTSTRCLKRMDPPGFQRSLDKEHALKHLGLLIMVYALK